MFNTRTANNRLQEIRAASRREYEARVAERGVIHFGPETPVIGLYSEDRASHEDSSVNASGKLDKRRSKARSSRQ